MLTLTLIAVGSQVAPVSAQQSGSPSFLPDELVVKLSSTLVLPDVAAAFGLDPVPLSQFGSRAIYRLRITDGSGVEQKVAALQADKSGKIIYVEPDYLYKAPEDTKVSWGVGNSFTTGGDLAAYHSQWLLHQIGITDAQKVTRGAGITVAVLDTGVDMTHPALAGHLIQGFDFVDNDTDPSEVGDALTGPFGHGTHVAGLVALVAPDSHIMPLRVMDQNGLSNVWVLAEALAYAVDPNNNQVTHRGADVINMSLGTLRQTHLLSSILNRVCNGPSPNVDDDLPGIGNPGVVVVAAAGNGGDGAKVYPAAEQINGLLAVASSDSSDALSLFSTRGPWIQVAAPGEQIMSTIPGGQYGTWSGTSMAAPVAAGEVALVRAAFTALKNAAVVRQVIVTSVRLQSPVALRIDANKAVNKTPEVIATLALPPASPPPAPTPASTPVPIPTPVPTKRGH